MVPTTLKNKGVELLDQGKWAGGFIRPSMLKSEIDFKKMAGIYYGEIKKLYGSDIHYFAGDPFHEGGNSNGIDVADYGKLIQTEMQKYFPNSTWVLQGWQSNPSSKLLSKLDKSKVLVQELFGENTQNWLTRKGYEGTPFIWCTVTNFGEKSGLYGKLQRIANEVYKANTSEYSIYMKGVGTMAEGVHNNSVLFDFIFDMGWHSEKVEVTNWIKSFVTARYGTNNKKVQEAWQGFISTVYSSFDKLQEGPNESVFCARPSTKVTGASTWGTRARNYDVDKFKEAVKLFVSASAEMKNSTTFQIDKIDFVRQVLSNKGEYAYKDMIEAFEKKDLDQFTKTSSAFLSLIKMQDDLLSSNEHFQLYSWLKQANDFGKTSIEKDLALKNAKMLVTYWGGPNGPKSTLHDYSNREWNGLMRNFYLPRWEMFVDDCLAKLKGENTTEPDYYKFETNWCTKPDLYKPTKIASTQVNVLVEQILNK